MPSIMAKMPSKVKSEHFVATNVWINSCIVSGIAKYTSAGSDYGLVPIHKLWVYKVANAWQPQQLKAQRYWLSIILHILLKYFCSLPCVAPFGSIKTIS
jgi:hypothetical protein